MQALITPIVTPVHPGVLARLDAWLERRRRRAIEAWLGTSKNIAELESRIRDLDRGVPHPYY